MANLIRVDGMGDPIRDLLTARVAATGISLAELSRAAGKNAAYMQQYLKRGTPKVLSRDVREALVPILGLSSADELLHPDERKGRLPISETAVIRKASVPPIGTLGRDVPLWGTATGGKRGDFLMSQTATDHCRRPPALASAQDVYAIYMAGTAMEPRHRPGELLYVNPNRPPSPGCDVLVTFIGPEGAPEEGMVREMVSMTADRLTLKQHNPPRDNIVFEMRHVRAVHRILTMTEAMGT